jgi:hypothetical protein
MENPTGTRNSFATSQKQISSATKAAAALLNVPVKQFTTRYYWMTTAYTQRAVNRMASRRVFITVKENLMTVTKKSLLITSVLALSSLPLASAKSYDIILNNPAKAGSLQLAAGEYKLKVDGTNAVFTDTQTDKSYTEPVKVEKADKKFDSTMVESRIDGQMENIHSIDLGGSPTKLEFGQ